MCIRDRSTREDRTWTVAYAASVEFSNTIIHVITNAIGIGVRFTVSAAFAERIKLVSFAVAIAFRNVCTSAFVNRTGAVADAALINLADTVVDVITDAIRIGVGRAVATTDAKRVQLVAVAVAIPFRNVCASALVDCTGAIAHTA